MLVPVTWPAGKVGAGHLLPDLRTRVRRLFVRVPGGKDVPHGMVAFVGTAVTAEDMLEKWESSLGEVAERDKALDQLEGYLRWIATQKLGSVFEAAYDSKGRLAARKIASSLPVVSAPLPE
jgi:hypothetical protein